MSTKPSINKQQKEPLDKTNSLDNSWLISPQPHLKTVGITILLMLSSVIMPFSMDIYTPSVPDMPAYFNTTESLVNLTIVGFCLFFAVGLLIFGPLSDKFGRKPILLAGIIGYIIGSILCALSVTIYMLIVARIISAIGAGAVGAVTTALVKDCYIVERRATMLTIIQMLTAIGPVVAPLFGGLIIQFASWRMIFWALSILGGLCLVATILFKETLRKEDRLDTGVIHSLSGLIRIGKDRKFMLILIVAALFNLPFMSYIAVGSYIYVDFFGETQQVYSYFFAVTAGISSLGPVIHLRFGKGLSTNTLMYSLLIAGIIIGVLMLFFGDKSVWAFAVFMILFTTLGTTIRPHTTNILLGITQGDTGSASSMINALNTGFGVIGMSVIMTPFPDFIIGISIIILACMVIGLPIWTIARKMQE